MTELFLFCWMSGAWIVTMGMVAGYQSDDRAPHFWSIAFCSLAWPLTLAVLIVVLVFESAGSAGETIARSRRGW